MNMKKSKLKSRAELEADMQKLNERLSELEISTDVNSSKLSVTDEIIGILHELPLGHTLINRAFNRSKLRYIKHVVIPRRIRQILKLQADKSMSDSIKDVLIDENTQLLIQAKRALLHRSSFEKKSANRVRGGFIKLQKFFSKKQLKQS